jgi:putative addiction module killer protein
MAVRSRIRWAQQSWRCWLGYRIYLKKQDDALVILLAGGDISSQDKDTRLAKDLARNL